MKLNHVVFALILTAIAARSEASVVFSTGSNGTGVITNSEDFNGYVDFQA